jgi:thiamine transport system substrate-binding protein
VGPTVEPDPGNAGGGNSAERINAFLHGGVFLLVPIRCGARQGKEKAMRPWIFLLIFWLPAGLTGPAAGKEPVLTLMTHDSFAVSQDVLNTFEKKHGVQLKILKSGDAGAALNQAILSKNNPLADVFFGVDNTFMSRALKAEIFEAYASPLLEHIPAELKLDPQNRLLPVDYGDVCLNYDKRWFAERNLPPPRRLEDLVKPAYKKLTVVQNPATSSPGLAFLLTTVGHFGETGYLDFWRKLRANEVYVTTGWSDAYYGQFTRARGGTRPIIVSYASSPPAEVYYSETPLKEAPTAAVLGPGTAFRQIEFAGILKRTRHRQLARKLIDFMLSPAFQKDIPLHMWMFPAVAGTPLPEVFTRYTRTAEAPVMPAPEVIDAGRETWIEAWTETVLR